MISKGLPVGSIVLAITEAQLPLLLEQMKLLTAFAAEVAFYVMASRSRLDKERQAAVEQQQLFQSHAREIVHEVTNPLTIIRNYLEVLRARSSQDESTQQTLATLNGEVERVRRILLRLTDVTEASPKVEGLVDINEAIREMVRVMTNAKAIPAHVAAHCKFDPKLPQIVTRENALKQVLLNLFRNAIEAISGAGTIFIITRDNVFLGNRRYIEIVVADSGTGVSEEVLNHLFEPFPSTKGPGHSGLGLVIVKRLIDELDGVVSCRPSEHGGARFHVLLPRRTEL